MIASAPYSPTGSLLNTPMANPQSSPWLTPEQHMRRAQKGHLDSFNELVCIHQDCIYRQALWILHDEDAAEDACQEAFVHAYRKIHTFDGPSVRSWLLRIVTNLCLDQLRAIKRHRNQPLEQMNVDGEEMEPKLVDPAETPDRLLERVEAEEAILRAMQRLTPEYRMVLVLVDIQELDYTEASAVLHIPLGTMKSRLARARAKLREELRGLGVIERKN
jgi:RNA polymerase sigma-70 factor, ECF subfamily